MRIELSLGSRGSRSLRWLIILAALLSGTSILIVIVAVGKVSAT